MCTYVYLVRLGADSAHQEHVPKALAFHSSCRLLLHPTEEMARHSNFAGSLNQEAMEGEEVISCDPKSCVPGSKGTVLVDSLRHTNRRPAA